METIENLSKLIDLHLNEKDMKNRNWVIKKSLLSGRGVFAKRDIKIGEIIFIEKPLLIGPTAKKDTNLNICSNCYNLLEIENNNDDDNENVCNHGCSLPICKNCEYNEKHLRDCDLYKKWKPIEINQINHNSLRFLTIARGLFLNENEKNLLYAMQANFSSLYKKEILNASKCFQKFPNDHQHFEYFYRIVSVLNTNAFETLCQRKSHEILLRGLYPLAGTINHDCIPNTNREFNDNQEIIIKACKFIPKGTEITTAYTKLLWNNMSRRMFLTVTKGFTCMCLRCCDPTEKGTFLNAIYCRKNDCFGWIIPDDCLEKTWTCMKCHQIYDINHVNKIQEFSLNAINSKITSKSCSIKELINFVNERVTKICPSSNQLTLEAKLNVIWRMEKSHEDYSQKDYHDKIRYCEEILQIIEKLDAGECTLRKLLLEEIEKTKNLCRICDGNIK